MATITHFTAEDLISCNKPESFNYDGSVGEYVADKFHGTEIPFSIFHGQPSLENEIIFNEENLPLLLSLSEGDFYVLETPGQNLAVQFVVALIIAVAVVVLTPTPELPQNVSRKQESPNNKLSSRANVARPLERVPDIKGKVLSVPDIVMPTYSTFENNIQIEHGFYCVGRKQLQIEEIKDGDTPIDLITNAGAAVYFPFNSPNVGTPDIAVGATINESVVIPFRSNEVNGIVLEQPNGTITFEAVNSLFTDLGDDLGRIDTNATPFIDVGANVTLQNVTVNDGFGGIVDISGVYPVLSKPQASQLIIDISSETWGFNGTQQGLDGFVFEEGDNFQRWTDYFYMTRSDFSSALINIVASNGMYQDDGTTISEVEVEFEIEFEGVDSFGNPDGNIETIQGKISGNDREIKGVTTTFAFANAKKFRARARRITRFDPNFSGVFVDEVKFADLYGIEDIGANHFGDVTTIQTITKATPTATAVKERRLNCIATEMLNVYEGSGVFAAELTPNTSAIQSFITDAIDPVIGRRTIDGIEADDILALESEILTYFGLSDLIQINYTFDSTDITFQEYTQILFNAINCIAFREAGKISALFESPQSTPSMLFTHRSKRPQSETHSRNFNQSIINDGVEFNYVDPVTNTTETIYIPSDKSALNPKRFNIPGIRTRKAATIRASREFNKILHKKIDLSLTVTAEGRYVRPNDMIAVVKGSRVQTFDGEILDQNGLELTLSSDVSFTFGDDHSITLKNSDGSVENIVVTEGSSSDKVILDSAPAETIRTGISSRRTEFSFGNDARHSAERWLAQEIDISNKWFVDIKAINYSDSYYQDDLQSLSAYSSGYSSGYS